tara:strand:- start:613 stop:714 length:102 start_codon:yes stop_codon:yes gene_type:complete
MGGTFRETNGPAKTSPTTTAERILQAHKKTPSA